MDKELLARTYNYYKGLPHQVGAVTFLWENTSPLVQERFVELWRDKGIESGEKSFLSNAPVVQSSFVSNVPVSPVPSPSKPTVTMLGLDRPVSLSDPIYPGSNFAWAEATKNGSRMPRSEMITHNIIELAQGLDRIRAILGNRPMVITSWYRPPEVNQRVGGSSRSNHLTGSAADFVLRGSNLSIDQQFNLIRPHWKGELLGYRGGRFIHAAIGSGQQTIWNR